MEAAAEWSRHVFLFPEQVGMVFPELRATVQYLYENRRQWNEMYLADIDTDTFKTPAEKGAERVGTVHYICNDQLSTQYFNMCQRKSCQCSLAEQRVSGLYDIRLRAYMTAAVAVLRCSVSAGEGHGKAESLPRQVRGLVQRLLWQPAREL